MSINDGWWFYISVFIILGKEVSRCKCVLGLNCMMAVSEYVTEKYM